MSHRSPSSPVEPDWWSAQSCVRLVWKSDRRGTAQRTVRTTSYLKQRLVRHLEFFCPNFPGRGYGPSEPMAEIKPLSMEQQKELMRLMTQHQRRLFGYIYTMLPNREAAEDILQETSLTICEKFSQFTPGTDFVAWAFQVAYWEVRRAKQKYARSRLVFGEDALAAVAATAAEMAPEMDVRHEALQHCLKKLHPRDREFVLLRYESPQGVEAAAKRVGRSLFAAYKALNRIRKLLLDCVSNRLELEANS